MKPMKGMKPMKKTIGMVKTFLAAKRALTTKHEGCPRPKPFFMGFISFTGFMSLDKALDWASKT